MRCAARTRLGCLLLPIVVRLGVLLETQLFALSNIVPRICSKDNFSGLAVSNRDNSETDKVVWCESDTPRKTSANRRSLRIGSDLSEADGAVAGDVGHDGLKFCRAKPGDLEGQQHLAVTF